MNHRLVSIVAAAAVTLASAPSLYSQAKLETKSGLYRIEGVVLSIDREKAVISVKQAGSRNISWPVVYTPQTSFTAGNEDAALDAVRVGSQVICLGKYEEPQAKTRMTAVRIEVRRR